MNRHRFFLTICTVLAGAAAALPQEPKPLPAPAPKPAPVPPALRDDLDEVRAQMEILRSQIDTEALRDSVREQIEAVQAQRFDLDEIRENARLKAEGARELVRAGVLAGVKGGIAGGVAGGIAGGVVSGVLAPFGIAPQVAFKGRHDSPDRAYERGQRALDSRNWDEALDRFTEAAGSGGSRADGAFYWKAYALAKLGRRDEALAAIAELRKSYASSRWLDDAKALELEVKQASGQKLSPEAENDEDLKLMALNGLVQSDPERALPLLGV